jgi:hypothetical protein
VPLYQLLKKLLAVNRMVGRVARMKVAMEPLVMLCDTLRFRGLPFARIALRPKRHVLQESPLGVTQIAPVLRT